MADKWCYMHRSTTVYRVNGESASTGQTTGTSEVFSVEPVLGDLAIIIYVRF